MSNRSPGLDGEERWPRKGTDLWFGRTDQVPGQALRERFLSALSPVERQQHAVLANDADREVYLLAHAMLRAALSHYFERPPGEWRLEPEMGGKPRIAAPLLAPLEFSLSHTRGLAVCAFAFREPVGVDVEPASRGEELQEVVGRQFAESEQRMLNRWPQPVRLERSVWLWTAKEALLKAWGSGMSVSLNSVCLDWDSGGRVRLEPAGEAVAQRWHFTRFRIDGQFLGTIALGGAPEPLRSFCVEGGELSARQVMMTWNSEGFVDMGN